MHSNKSNLFACAQGAERSTTRNYFFTDKPAEDAITRCEKYFQELQELVIECHNNFKLP